MKRFIIGGTIIIASTFFGCEPSATFDQPQPVNTKSLSTFPANIKGDYLSADQASTLSINDSISSRTYDFDYKISKDSLPLSYKLSGDTLIDVTNKTAEKVLLKADTVFQHVHWIDTLFMLSADNIARHYKGYYFLNIRYGNKQWMLQKLSLKNGTLTVASISRKDDINLLKAITETSSDTTAQNFKLTRKQFRKFVKQHGFGDEETFTKINKNVVREIEAGAWL